MGNVFGRSRSFLTDFGGLFLLLFLGFLSDAVLLSKLDHLKLILDICVICFILPWLFLLISHLSPLFTDHFGNLGYLFVGVLLAQDGSAVVVVEHVSRQRLFGAFFLFFGSLFVLL